MARQWTGKPVANEPPPGEQTALHEAAKPNGCVACIQYITQREFNTTKRIARKADGMMNGIYKALLAVQENVFISDEIKEWSVGNIEPSVLRHHFPDFGFEARNVRVRQNSFFCVHF